MYFLKKLDLGLGLQSPPPFWMPACCTSLFMEIIKFLVIHYVGLYVCVCCWITFISQYFMMHL